MTDQHDQNPDNKPRPKNIRDGDIKASIWRNESDKGVFHTVSLARTYEDKEGNLRDTNNYRGADLLRVAEVARQAYTRSRAMDREERRAAFKEARREPRNSNRSRDRDR